MLYALSLALSLAYKKGQIWHTEADKYEVLRIQEATAVGCTSDKLPQVNCCPASKAKVIFTFL